MLTIDLEKGKLYDMHDKPKRPISVPSRFKKFKRGSNYTPPKKKRKKK